MHTEPREEPVKHSAMLTVTSMLSILLFTLHMADDIVRGVEKGNMYNFAALPTAAVWMFGALVLAGRRSGYVIMLLGSLYGLLLPFAHMRGRGIGVAFAKSEGLFFFAWTLLALGLTCFFSLLLSMRELWSLRRSAQPKPVTPPLPLG
jgi:hypothetical protein